MKHLIASAFLALAAVAQAQPAPDVKVEGAWARPTVQGQTSGGVYMTLTAREPLTLVGASTPVASSAEVHEMKMEGDVMRMREVGSLPLRPGQPLRLSPGGFHLMLTPLKLPLRLGTQVPVQLRFRDGGGAIRTLDVSVPVAIAAPTGGAAAAEHKH